MMSAAARPDPVVPGAAGVGSLPDLAAQPDGVPAAPLALERPRPSRAELRRWWRWSKNGSAPHECETPGCPMPARGEQRVCQACWYAARHGDDEGRRVLSEPEIHQLGLLFGLDEESFKEAQGRGVEIEIDARAMDRAFDRVLRTR